ncbi:hypothetical protein E2320_007204, partial [Naja naja]
LFWGGELPGEEDGGSKSSHAVAVDSHWGSMAASPTFELSWPKSPTELVLAEKGQVSLSRRAEGRPCPFTRTKNYSEEKGDNPLRRRKDSFQKSWVFYSPLNLCPRKPGRIQEEE